MTLLFVSNDNLSQTIAYPIITVLPGGVAALWSVFYFREIKVYRYDSSHHSIFFSFTIIREVNVIKSMQILHSEEPLCL
uniref:Transmembrane protein n=1 Tax=Ascaris lumbricoides TaxID=6252 RepID=A0A0M3IXT1_ASCLU